jgi:enoyl-CoA hydratase/carnithine racemase
MHEIHCKTGRLGAGCGDTRAGDAVLCWRGGKKNGAADADVTVLALAVARATQAIAIVQAIGCLVCALQGRVIGGGLALAMTADYRMCEKRATFENGNLSIVVCPIGNLSAHHAGLKAAMDLYLHERVADAAEALQLRLVHEIVEGIAATQKRAMEVARIFSHDKEGRGSWLKLRRSASVPIGAVVDSQRRR